MTQTQIPSKAQILEWVSDNPDANSKRDIAKAFGIKGAARIELKRMLKDLEGEGLLGRRRGVYRDAGKLPPVTVVQILPPDADGDIFAKPVEWQGDGAAPREPQGGRGADPGGGAGDECVHVSLPRISRDRRRSRRGSWRRGARRRRRCAFS